MFTKLSLFYVQIVNANQPGNCVHSQKKEKKRFWIKTDFLVCTMVQIPLSERRVEQRCGNCDDVDFRFGSLYCAY